MEKIKKLKSFIKIKEEEINIKNLDLYSLKQELFELEWPLMPWNDLEKWLKENRPENKYEKNPIIKRTDGHCSTYCKLNSDGELQVGAWYNNDDFPRGEDLRVHHEFESWR